VEHGTAIKWIVCYLKKTKHMGLVICPSSSNMLHHLREGNVFGFHCVSSH
jgi:hypothetical protein